MTGRPLSEKQDKKRRIVLLTIGCHLSAAKGFAQMGRDAVSIGANTFQYFTRNPRGSKARAIDEADVAGAF